MVTLKGLEYLVLNRKDRFCKTRFQQVDGLDKFANFFDVDPHYFERTWLMMPNNSESPMHCFESSSKRLPWQP